MDLDLLAEPRMFGDLPPKSRRDGKTVARSKREARSRLGGVPQEPRQGRKALMCVLNLSPLRRACVGCIH